MKQPSPDEHLALAYKLRHRRPALSRAALATLHVLLAAVGYLSAMLHELRRIRRILDTRLPGPTTSVGLEATTTPKENRP